MKMKNKVIDNHNRLYEYLDWFSFYNEFEIAMAIHDFYKDHNDNCSYQELIEYNDTAKEYIKDRKLDLENFIY